MGDFSFLRRKFFLCAGEPVSSLFDGHVGRFHNVQSVDFDGQCFRFQAFAAAKFAGCRRLVFGKLFAYPCGIRFQKTPFHVRNNALKRLVGHKSRIIHRHADVA